MFEATADSCDQRRFTSVWVFTVFVAWCGGGVNLTKDAVLAGARTRPLADAS